MSTAEVWVRNSSMKDYDGEITNLELGQIFTMRNCLNDEKLLDLRYVNKVLDEEKDGISECIGCGKRFIGMGYRNQHAERARHDPIYVDGPQLKSPSSEFNPAASGPERELELVGAPAPTPADGDLGSAHGSRKGSSGPGSKANEVIRLG